MTTFVNSYEKIKHIQFKESVGINEISKFMIDQQGVNELRKMVDIYDTSIESHDATAIIALATVGSCWETANNLAIL